MPFPRNPRLLPILIIILSGASGVFADATTTASEKVNPFNQFMSPEGGVNLISGDASFPIELFKMPGRNGMDLTFTLRYSSNVYNQVRARNDVNPTGWVGLGWAFGFGSILSDHKNTMITTDDEVYWVSPEGLRKKIIFGAGRHYLEDEPYWKVARILASEGAGDMYGYRIKGWVITDPSGKVYKYGNPDGSNSSLIDPLNATRWTYCWTSSKYVGEGSAASPVNYPYQWDLSAITDLYGNTSSFEYDTTADALLCAVDNNTPANTKLPHRVF